MFFVGAAGDALADQFGTLSNHNFEFWFEVMPYLLGSVFYWISSLICLWLWKNQHYGLVMLGNRTQWHRLSKPKSGSLGWGQFAILNIILMTATGRSAAHSACFHSAHSHFNARSHWLVRIVLVYSAYSYSQLAVAVATMNESIRFVRWSMLKGVWSGSRLLLQSTISLIEVLGFFLLFSFLHKTPKEKPVYRLMTLAWIWISLRLVSECSSFVFTDTILQDIVGVHEKTHWVGFISR